MNPISGGGGRGFLRAASDDLQAKLRQLSSGKRINSAGDDAAGMAIARRLDARTVSLSQAARNGHDAQSMLQIADAGLGGAAGIIGRLRELAVQSASSTTGDTGRAAIQQEASALQQELQRIEGGTEFNGRNVFSDTDTTVTVQVGADAGDALDVELGGSFVSSLGLDSIDLSTRAGAAAALEQLDAAQEGISARRASFGAAYNRLGIATQGLEAAQVPLAAARSRIEDQDIASGTSELVAARIRNQAAVAMQAHRAFSANLLGQLLSTSG